MIVGAALGFLILFILSGVEVMVASPNSPRQDTWVWSTTLTGILAVAFTLLWLVTK